MTAKSIPQTRDRIQSLRLSGVVGLLLAWCCAGTMRANYALYGPRAILPGIAISVVFALVAWGLKAATPAAAVAGGAICFLLTVCTTPEISKPFASALTPLLALFVLTFLATRAGRRRKVASGLAESRRGRNVSQVIANLGAAALCAYTCQAARSASQVLVLAALAEATADTVSSEIGQAFGGRPWLLTTWRRVPAGTDGAISPQGTAAGVFAAALLIAVAAGTMHPGIPGLTTAFIAGCTGLLFDSLLGATVERKGWLGNDLVNFASTVFSIILALCLLRLVYPA